VIVEIDGGDYHPASRAAADHERDLPFLEQGVVVMQFNAVKAYADP
jgi:very-short-patch-repair endonuclease